MATAILRSQDCLRDRFHQQTLTSPPFKSRRNPNPKPNANANSNPSSRYLRRKRSPLGSQDNGRDRDRMVLAKSPARNLVMGQVTILKRGETLSSAELAGGDPKDCRRGQPERGKEDKDLVLCSTERLGPEPETVQKQVRVSEINLVDGLYAGSAFFTSPPPSSLPFPAFFAKKEKKNDAATSDLRRLLRLDVL